MGGRVEELFPLVVGPGDYPLLEGDDDRSDGHLILVGRQRRLLQCHLHVGHVKRVPRVRQRQIQGGPVQSLLLLWDITPARKSR